MSNRKSTLALAFYHGEGDWADKLVRIATRSRYSHCELVDMRDNVCISASKRDGGVRAKRIDLNSGRWDIILTPWAQPNAFALAAGQIGARYDYLGAALGPLLGVRSNDPSRWFCSELCGYALGWQLPHLLSPGSLHDAAAWGAEART